MPKEDFILKLLLSTTCSVLSVLLCYTQYCHCCCYYCISVICCFTLYTTTTTPPIITATKINYGEYNDLDLFAYFLPYFNTNVAAAAWSFFSLAASLLHLVLGGLLYSCHKKVHLIYNNNHIPVVEKKPQSNSNNNINNKKP